MKETPRRTKQCIRKLPLFGAGRKWNCARRRARSRRLAGWWCSSSFCDRSAIVEAVKQLSAVSSDFSQRHRSGGDLHGILAGGGGGSAAICARQLLRADTALHQVLGMSRFPSDDTMRNLFKRFGQGQCQRFFLRSVGLAAGTASGMCRGIQFGSGLHGVRAVRPSNRVRCAVRIRASMDGPRIIRCWRCWPRRTFCCTDGCAAGTAAARAGWWNFSRKRWRCCRRQHAIRVVRADCGLLSTSNYWAFWKHRELHYIVVARLTLWLKRVRRASPVARAGCALRRG